MIEENKPTTNQGVNSLQNYKNKILEFIAKISPLFKKNKKMVILASALVFLILLLLITSSIKPAPKNNKSQQINEGVEIVESGERVYVNYTHNYSVTVPSGWITEEGGYAFIGSPGEVAFVPIDEKGNKKNDGVIAITVMPDSGGRYQLSGKSEFEKWLIDEPKEEENKRVYKSGDTRLSGLQAVEFIDKSLDADPGKKHFRRITWLYTDRVFHPIKTDVFWNIYIELGDDKVSEKYLEDYKKIVSSFKLLNPGDINPSPSPSTSPVVVSLDQEYVNDKLDYKINYPSNWTFITTHETNTKITNDIVNGISLSFINAENNEKQDILLDVIDARELQDINNWINLYDFNYPKSTTKEEFKFKNLNAVRLIYNEETGQKEAIYFIQKKYVFRIVYTGTPTLLPETRSIINSLDPDYNN